jgi:hypothetical protein
MYNTYVYYEYDCMYELGYNIGYVLYILECSERFMLTKQMKYIAVLEAF